MAQFRYSALAQQLRDEITSGQWAVGARMPSVRALCEKEGTSKATVLSAYAQLEAQGLIESRPRSGYYVASTGKTANIALPSLSHPQLTPAPVTYDQLLIDLMEKGAAFDLVPSVPEGEGNALLKRCLSRAHRQQCEFEQSYYDEPSGLPALRRQLAKRVQLGGGQVTDDELVVTSGCQHALMLALMATTQPGDIVAVESPSFYGVFQLIEMLGLKALELPSSASTGLNLNVLKEALGKWPIKVLVCYPAFGTPAGASMPDEHKAALVELCQQHQLPIIEDDIYAELYFGYKRPRTLYSFADDGSVLLCSSLSKSVSRDLRLGWICPGRYIDAVKRLKVVTSLASSQTIQHGVSQFISEGGLDKHLRAKRLALASQCAMGRELIHRLVPEARSISHPNGGLALWVEVDTAVDTLALYETARQSGIVITPGGLFTSQKRYQAFLRISFEQPWNELRTDALKKLSQLIRASCD